MIDALRSLRILITLSSNSSQCYYQPNQVHANVTLYMMVDGKLEEISESSTYLTIDTGVEIQPAPVVPKHFTEDQIDEINEYLKNHPIVKKE